MPKIIADANIEGQVRYIAELIRADDVWSYFISELDLEFITFDDIGLSKDASDREVWNAVQKCQGLLVTDNRNSDKPDSLHATILDSNTPASLPVITIGRVQRVFSDKEYALRVVQRLLLSIIDLDNLLGTGRIFIP